MVRTSLLTLLTLLSFSLASCEGSSEGDSLIFQCWTKVDCPQNQICANSICRSPSGCANDLDCAESDYCTLQGICEPRVQCSFDSECNLYPWDSQVCRDGLCFPTESCKSNAECNSGYYCDASKLCRSLIAGGGCWYDSDCKPSCSIDADCPGTTSTCTQGKWCSLSESYYCGDDRICHFGSSCKNQESCPEGHFCGPFGYCQESSCKRQACEPGFRCGSDGNCYAYNEGCPSLNNCYDCNTSSDCSAGYICESGTCTNSICSSQTDCPLDFECGLDGRCYPSLACADQDDCPGNELCLGGNCVELYACLNDNDCPKEARCGKSSYCISW